MLRRVRAQEEIGEIEKERIQLKQKLDIRNSDYELKAQVEKGGDRVNTKIQHQRYFAGV